MACCGAACVYVCLCVCRLLRRPPRRPSLSRRRQGPRPPLTSSSALLSCVSSISRPMILHTSTNVELRTLQAGKLMDCMRNAVLVVSVRAGACVACALRCEALTPLSSDISDDETHPNATTPSYSITIHDRHGEPGGRPGSACWRPHHHGDQRRGPGAELHVHGRQGTYAWVAACYLASKRALRAVPIFRCLLLSEDIYVAPTLLRCLLV